ncbi:MAG: sigma-70 family RNA polymerase sigma factor [Armatimonas sp.]
MRILTAMEQAYRTHCTRSLAVEQIPTEAALRQIFITAKNAWPEVELPFVTFVRHLAERASDAPPPQQPDVLMVPHAAELYLACACEQGDGPALAAFERHYLQVIPAALKRTHGALPADVAAELCQTLREKLFVAAAGQRPKIAQYNGHGSLKGWLRVVALRTAISSRRGAPAQRTQPLDELPADALPLSAELALLQRRYQADVKATLQAALTALPAKYINVLRLQLLDGLTLEQIGGLYRKNRSTVKRWLDDAHSLLLADIRRQLQARLQLSDQDLAGLIALLRSQLDLSLSRILQRGDP